MENFNDLMVFATLISPVILGVIELIKHTVEMPKNHVPLMSVIVGLLVGFAAQPFTDLDIVLRLWAGGLAGLSATGLFELINQRTGTTKNKEVK